MANPTDNTYAIVRQTGEGVVPVSPSFVYLDNNDGNVLNLTSKTLTSGAMRPNREVAAVRKTSFANTVTFKTELCRHSGYDMMMESVLGGTFVSSVLKGGNVDTFHTLEKTLLDGATVRRQRAADVTFSKMQLTVDAENYGVVTYSGMGTSRTDTAPLLTNANYAAATQGSYMTGADVGSITIGGLTASYMSLDLTVDQAKDSKFRLGSASAFGTASKGARQTKLTLKLFRTDFTPETLFIPDTPIAVSFSIGTAGNGYSFALPAAVAGTIPQSDTSGSSEMVTVELMATNDATSGTGIIVTKL